LIPKGIFLIFSLYFISSTKLFKKQIPHAILLGKPFNSEFELEKDTQLKYIGPINDKTFQSLSETIVGSVSEPISTSNKELYDTNTAQQLSSEKISELQETGITGAELVQNIVENSSTFATKTAYSQAKYIKKKEKKYVKKIYVYSPTIMQICQFYMEHEPGKIWNMRFDALSFIMHVGDIIPGNSLTISENLNGLILGAAVERMGGEGKINYVYPDGHLNIDILTKLNSSSGKKKIVTYTNMQTLLEKTDCKLLDIVLKEQENDSNSLIICNSKYHPIDLIKILWKFLAKSGAFVIYHQFLHTLTETEAFIQDNKLSVFTHLEELWLRKYQVLKDRTHPEMTNEHATSGYILYGYKISELNN